MLQEHGGGERVDIPLAATSRATHFANRAKRGSGREPLVNETRREARAFLQLGRDVTRFDGSRRVVAILVQREADNESLDLQLPATPNHLGDRRAFARAAQNETGRRRDRSRRVADGEADATFTVVDGEEANEGGGKREARSEKCEAGNGKRKRELNAES